MGLLKPTDGNPFTSHWFSMVLPTGSHLPGSAQDCQTHYEQNPTWLLPWAFTVQEGLIPHFSVYEREDSGQGQKERAAWTGESPAVREDGGALQTGSDKPTAEED